MKTYTCLYNKNKKIINLLKREVESFTDDFTFKSVMDSPMGDEEHISKYDLSKRFTATLNKKNIQIHHVNIIVSYSKNNIIKISQKLDNSYLNFYYDIGETISLIFISVENFSRSFEIFFSSESILFKCLSEKKLNCYEYNKTCLKEIDFICNTPNYNPEIYNTSEVANLESVKNNINCLNYFFNLLIKSQFSHKKIEQLLENVFFVKDNNLEEIKDLFFIEYDFDLNSILFPINIDFQDNEFFSILLSNVKSFFMRKVFFNRKTSRL